MAKSARASVTKKNNQALKRKVFGPAETARNDRLNAKLLELAQQPKPLRAEMDVEEDGLESAAPEAKDNDRATKDIDMNTGAAAAKPAEKSNKALKREKTSKAAKIEKKRVRKPRNTMTFAKHPKKAAGGKKR